MRDLNDSDLIRRIVKHDDRRAFSVLLNRHQQDVRNTLRGLCNGEWALADDIAQDVFLKVYRYLPGFKGKSSFRTWLYRITLNSFLTTQRLKASLFFSSEKELAAAQAPVANNPDAQRDIQRAMQQLSDGQRLMVDLNLVRGFSHQEIEAITGVPLGTIKSHIQRAREKLQTALQDWEET